MLAEAEAKAAAKAVAKREALRVQAKKQAAQRKAREAQNEMALRRAEKQKEEEAFDVSNAIIKEILGAVEDVADAKAKKKAEAFSIATAIVEEVLDVVESVGDASTEASSEWKIGSRAEYKGPDGWLDCTVIERDAGADMRLKVEFPTAVVEITIPEMLLGHVLRKPKDVASEDAGARNASKKTKVELKAEKNMQTAREIAALRGNAIIEEEVGFRPMESSSQSTYQETEHLTESERWLAELLQPPPPPLCSTSSHEESMPHVNETSANHSYIQVGNGLPPPLSLMKRVEDEKLANAQQPMQQASHLTAVERDILKLEKKIREINKLEERQKAGEELEKKQLEKLTRTEDITMKLQELHVAREEEQRMLAEEAERQLIEEQSRQELIERTERQLIERISLQEQKTRQPEREQLETHNGSQQNKVVRLLTRQTAAPGLSPPSHSVTASPPLAREDTGGRTVSGACIRQLHSSHAVESRTPPCASHVDETRSPSSPEDLDVEDSSNIPASVPLVAPRILLRPQGLSRQGDAASHIEPLPTLEQKQRDYAAARARIFQEAPGHHRKGAARGRGRGSYGGVVAEKKVSHDFKSDPDYDRSRVQLVAPGAASDSASDSASESDTDSDYDRGRYR